MFAEPDSLELGSEIYSLGFPLTNVLGAEVKYSAGVVSGKNGMKDKHGTFQHSAPTQPGNSGGPVFLKDGRLCGVVVSTLNVLTMLRQTSLAPQNVNHAIGIDVIKAFLEREKLWNEIKEVKRSPLKVEEAKAFAVRIETFAQGTGKVFQPPTTTKTPVERQALDKRLEELRRMRDQYFKDSARPNTSQK